MKAIDLSQYVLAKFYDSGDLITNKKLQKLLYYIEAWSLVYLDSIVDEDFEAWIHGPVIRDLYRQYKSFGSSPIEIDIEGPSKFIKQFNTNHSLSADQIELIDNVLRAYGSLSSFQLETLSHNESPWIQARKGYAMFDTCSVTISKQLMKEYYTSLLHGKSN